MNSAFRRKFARRLNLILCQLRATESIVFDDRIHIARNSRKVEALRGVHRGARAFVLGNGPSLNVGDLNRLRGEITFAANKIYLVFPETEWRPTYYNVEDPLVIEQTWREINQLKGFTKLLKRDESGLLQPDDDTIFYDLVVLREEKFPGFSDSPHRGLSCGYTVCLSSIQWAWFMGIREIVLLGVDFSFQVPQTDMDGNLVSTGERNHFHPAYRPTGEKWMPPKLDQQRRAFEFARHWMEQRGGRLVNASRRTKLDVLERANLEDLL